MNKQNNPPAGHVTFQAFLFKNKINPKVLKALLTLIIIQFVIFKYFYPSASYIHGDSFSYINAAAQNLTINTYPIGYSKFLRMVNTFAKPDIVLVTIQFLLIEGASLFLLATLYHFYSPSRTVQIILLVIVTLNPLFLHLANLVSSDGFFLALSLIWISLLLWIINRPSNNIIIWHALILLFAFTTRYNAMIYPIISGITFLLSKLSLRKKAFGVGLSFVLCTWFIGVTMYQYKRLTNSWQYSPFSGWQFSNNAMYTYRYVEPSERKPVPQKFKALDKNIRDFFDSTRDKKYVTETFMANTFYMWSRNMPLMNYRDSLFGEKSTASELKRWASMGPLYKEYGFHIIRTYPFHFLKFFVWPNANKYYAPPIEFLEAYNSGHNGVTEQAKNWFGYSSTDLKTRWKNKNVWVLNFYPILSGCLNLVMVCVLISFLLLNQLDKTKKMNKAVLLVSTVWIINALFTITASPAALRFQSFPLIITLIFVSLLIDWMIKLLSILKNESNQRLMPTEMAI